MNMDMELLQILMLLLSQQQQPQQPQVEKPSSRSCKIQSFQPQNNFDIRSYVGFWYVMLRSPHHYSQYYPQLDNLKVAYYIDNDQTLRAYPGGRYRNQRSKICQFNRGKVTPGRLFASRMRFKMRNLAQVFGGAEYLDREQVEYDYWVIATDYVSYAVVYTCWVINMDGTCANSDVMVLSRYAKGFEKKTFKVIQQKLANTCVDYNTLVVVNHDGACPFIKNNDAKYE